MNSIDEAAFEEHIASWLVEHGGYLRAKVGTAGGEPRDFDAATADGTSRSTCIRCARRLRRASLRMCWPAT